MGNCIIRQNKIMVTYGQVFEQKEPMKVPHLWLDANMVGGQMYYPVPLQVPSRESNKNTKIEAEPKGDSGVVRIKLVISKQELDVMLRKGGVSVGDLVSHITKTESSNEVDDEDAGNCGKWKPVLHSIPELN